MNTSSPYSRPSDDALRQMPARQPAGAVEGPWPADCPSVREVLGEIGITLAAHLAAALAITLALQAYGIV